MRLLLRFLAVLLIGAVVLAYMQFLSKVSSTTLQGSNGVPNEKKAIRSLIVATWRTGSSFLGQVLRSYPGTYYSYEPARILSGLDVIRPGDPVEHQAVSMLSQLLRCHYESLDNSLMDKFTKDKWIMENNIRLAPLCENEKELCQNAAFLSDICKAFPVQAIKTVRVRLDVIPKLLGDEDLNVKVLYLIRDPRAIMNSRFPHEPCMKAKECGNPFVLCEDLTHEYHVSNKLSQLYPDRFKVIRYEELTKNVFQEVKHILEFLGLVYHEKVQEFLETHTKGGNKGHWDTHRDIRATAYHWMQDLAQNFTVIKKIQDSCDEAMKLWNYKFLSEKDVQSTAAWSSFQHEP